MRYTIYHGTKEDGTHKIGCTEMYPDRCKKQALIDYYIIEQHDDIRIASEREQYLQAEYGYRVDQIPYYMAADKERASKAGKHRSPNGGKTQSPNGGKVTIKKEYACPRCGRIGKGPRFKHHIDQGNGKCPK